MPRPRNCDRDEAVIKACNAFWQYGYDALGIRALEALTGLNRFAIQTEFGGKEGLFLKALEKYTQDAERYLFQPVRTGNLDQIEYLYRQFVTPLPESAQIFGCLVVNTVVENAVPARVAIKAHTERHLKLLEEAIGSALVRAKAEGQLAGDFDVDGAVAFLMGSVMGVQVMIRKAGSIEAAKPYVEMLVKTINAWRVA